MRLIALGLLCNKSDFLASYSTFCKHHLQLAANAARPAANAAGV
jgi:hypothetical protein